MRGGWHWSFIEKRSHEGANQTSRKKLQIIDEIVRFLKFRTKKYHVAHSNARKKINNFFGM
jgi:hypothetical protein